jgi:hypothetical protein
MVGKFEISRPYCTSICSTTRSLLQGHAPNRMPSLLYLKDVKKQGWCVYLVSCNSEHGHTGVLSRFGRVARHQTSGKGTGLEAVNWTNRVNVSYEGTQYRVRRTLTRITSSAGLQVPGLCCSQTALLNASVASFSMGSDFSTAPALYSLLTTTC